MKVVKKILNILVDILIVFVLIASLLIAVMALTSRSSGISTVFGYTIQSIQSDSMKGGSPDGYEGGDFEKGDLLIGKSTGFDSEVDYKLGDIVTYQSEDSSGKPMLIVHRIVDIQENSSGDQVYQTWGDNREVAQVPDQDNEDEYLMAYEIGSVIYSDTYEAANIKGLGKVLDYIQTQQGFFFVVLVPMIIFFMYELVRVVLNATVYKKEKSKEEKEQAEKDKQEAVEAAVAEAIARQNAAAPSSEMTAEQMEQFKQFMAFQEAQKAQQETAQPEPTKAADPAPAESDDSASE